MLCEFAVLIIPHSAAAIFSSRSTTLDPPALLEEVVVLRQCRELLQFHCSRRQVLWIWLRKCSDRVASCWKLICRLPLLLPLEAQMMPLPHLQLLLPFWQL